MDKEKKPHGVADSDLTLDPQDWEAFRALAHRMIDDSLDHLTSLRERPPWTPPPPDVEAALSSEPLPTAPQGAEQVYAQFLEQVLPYTAGNRHPRFWGWMKSNGTPLGMMADMLAASMNVNAAGLHQSATLVELQVIKWLAEVMGFPPTSSGIMASGGTMANVIGLAVGRHARAGFDLRQHGVYGQPRLTVYGSVETHSWATKCLELMGMGRDSFRAVPVDEHFRVDVAAMRRMIIEDRAAGMRPICVLGTAGTINTGAIDDLDALADLANEQALWFHVDGAVGSLGVLSPTLRPLFRGQSRADSLAFDLHKWGYLPYEVACILVRDAKAHRDTFATAASYLKTEDRGMLAGGLVFAERGVELSRNFKALKAWMTLKAEGTERLAAIIEQNVAQARRFGAAVAALKDVTLEVPVSFNIACWRITPEGTTPEQQDLLTREVLLRLQETGIAACSSTIVHGRTVIRVAVANHRCRWADFEQLLAALPAVIAEARRVVIASSTRRGGPPAPH
ncbi:MAG: amino acid decarboxylase [Gammaproteobacteria bacterium]|nr:amino acid decarboxylase [Gammaproteobacteria bacterium]